MKSSHFNWSKYCRIKHFGCL